MFNVFEQTQKELDNFFHEKVLVVSGEKNQKRFRPLSKQTTQYAFNQYETLNLVELYYNSKFQSSEYDSEGHRKSFLNISQFRADVASKMVDLDTKDFVFIPEDSNSVWPAWFLSREFKVWAKDKKLSQLINKLIVDYPKYGTAVVKQVGDDVVRVPLRNLRNSQGAESLEEADYVIEEHQYTRARLKEVAEERGWDIEGIEINDDNFDEEITVYERYGLVPETMFDGDDKDKMIKSLVILTIDTNEDKNKDKIATGTILFKDIIKQLPYREVHWKKQDGRWLGIGEIETQFENQLARNVVENLRRRALLWSSKKVFQSPDDTVVKNIIRDVKDGEVLRIAPNGQITQINMSTQALADFANNERTWEENSNQKSFTFEVATGESLPSATPFRLGVILSSAVKSHFDLKRENLGLFLKDVVVELVIPNFSKNKRKEHIFALVSDEEGLQTLKEALITMHVNKRMLDEVMNRGLLPDHVFLRQSVEEEMNRRNNLFLKIPDSYYDGIKYKVELVITGESVDVGSKIETLKTVLQLVASNPALINEPATRSILNRVVSLTGENLDSIVGKMISQVPMGQKNQVPNLKNQESGLKKEMPLLTSQPGTEESKI